MYTTCTPTTADKMARVMAGGRITDDRRHALLMATEAASEIRSVLRAEGASRIGFKIVHDDGHKERVAHHIDSDACFALLIRTYGMDAEVWGLTAEGHYTSSVY